MSKTKAQTHIHRYQKTFPNIRRVEPIWACSLPGCTHFIPLNTRVWGRQSLCWECGVTFTMDENEDYDEMPKCFDCMRDVERGIIPSVQPSKPIIQPSLIPSITTHAEPESPDDEAAKEERKKLKTSLRLRIKLYRETGLPTGELEEQLKKL